MKYLILVLFALTLLNHVDAQQPEMQNYSQPDQRGVAQFEDPKKDGKEIEGVKVRVGGGMALQFQGLNQQNDANNLVEIGKNFNLPTANLDLDVQFLKGVRMHLRTYLSSRNHPEPYVKGGYLQVDNLDFIREGFFGNLMEKVRIRVGHMENNYIGGRYNTTSGQLRNVETDKVSVKRLNIGGGFFMSKNILTKLEYVSQSYKDYADTRFAGGKFVGINVEAAISF